MRRGALASNLIITAAHHTGRRRTGQCVYAGGQTSGRGWAGSWSAGENSKIGPRNGEVGSNPVRNVEPIQKCRKESNNPAAGEAREREWEREG